MAKIRLHLLLIFFSLFLGVLWLCSSARAEENGAVNLTTDVQPVISLSLGSNSFDFGSLSPGVTKRGSGGVYAVVSTDSANGYNLGVSDGASGSQSALLSASDGTTRIPDFTDGSVNSPALWNPGTSKGLGITVYDADTAKEAKWGTGTSYNDENNKYAGIPGQLSVIHSTNSYKSDPDYTYIGFIIDVTSNQKSGMYSGNITFTATASL